MTCITILLIFQESEKSRRRSSADQDLSHPPGKRRKTRADN